MAAVGSGDLTHQELRLQRALMLLAALFAALAGSYVLQGILGDAEYPFVANSVAKDGLLAALCAVGASDLRRFSWAVLVVIGGHVLIVLGLLVCLVAGDISSIAATFAWPPNGLPAETVFFVWLGLASAVILLLTLLHRSAVRSRYELRYLSQLQHRTAMALAEVLVVGDEELLTPEQIARNVDDYLYSFSARDKWKAKLALVGLTFYPLLRLHLPYPLMSPERRLRFVERRFVADVAERRLPRPIRRVVQSMLFAVQQLVFIGYYADPRTATATGYVPFSQRPGYESAMRRVKRDRPAVSSRSPREIDADDVSADVVVIGSGAAGATLARRLAERGREILVLERGKHVDPSQFTEDERVQFSNLYSDGGLQMSRDARFQVLQGMCVGGTTVVNNAVCFDLPERVLERWNDPHGLDAGLDPNRLRESFARLRRSLPVTRQGDDAHLNPGAQRFVEGVRQLGLDDPPGRLQVVEANIHDCLGCGYCNIGCAYGKKLSMLDTTLPEAQREFGEEAVRIYSECYAERIEQSDGRADAVLCQLSDGRRVRVSANTIVVTAGALASSLLLLRSRIRTELAGRHLSFNMGAPMTAEFEEKLDSYAGLQISHSLEPPGEKDLVLEAWFNPVGAQSLFMPGWFSDHFRNMRRYDHMACVGSVVGTARNGSVRPGLFGRGMRLDYEPTPDDLGRLVRGLKLIGRAFLAAGALRVMPTTFRYLPIESEEELDELDRVVRDNTDIQLHSSHPQGGNPVSDNPAKGVVDPSFRVWDLDNLYVCDASVFPSAITVNPQLTVMALADYAAEGIA